MKCYRMIYIFMALTLSEVFGTYLFNRDDMFNMDYNNQYSTQQYTTISPILESSIPQTNLGTSLGTTIATTESIAVSPTLPPLNILDMGRQPPVPYPPQYPMRIPMFPQHPIPIPIFPQYPLRSPMFPIRIPKFPKLYQSKPHRIFSL
ncbi:uncharacterized protein LOC119606325 [Lucilia sericata]|uniref:uncharacterized protein LOC119606325 n=1 Tax=Lucilia sericata TaxID=13632 RepID=UPI0018A8670A|nr:uncharacterized protein LOC119606325 [Lucilia sericata]